MWDIWISICHRGSWAEKKCGWQMINMWLAHAPALLLSIWVTVIIHLISSCTVCSPNRSHDKKCLLPHSLCSRRCAGNSCANRPTINLNYREKTHVSVVFSSNFSFLPSPMATKSERVEQTKEDTLVCLWGSKSDWFQLSFTFSYQSVTLKY